MWNDHVHVRKKPSWSVTSPDRRNLDLLLCTWTPASPSLQPRAPDPGEYGDQSALGCRGKYWAPQWSYARNAGRPCLARDPPPKVELDIRLPGSFSRHPTRKAPPQWSLLGKDRSMLPYDTPTWTPQMNSDTKPGPGAYDLDRRPRWKPANRRGCTWGGRTRNLHPEMTAWVPRTKGSQLCCGEWARLPQCARQAPPPPRSSSSSSAGAAGLRLAGGASLSGGGGASLAASRSVSNAGNGESEGLPPSVELGMEPSASQMSPATLETVREPMDEYLEEAGGM